MSGDLYENDKQDIVADCVLCKKQIVLETEEYYEIGVVHHDPTGIYCNANEIRAFTHAECHKEIQEGLSEAIQLLINQIVEEGEVLGFNEN